MSDNYQAVYDAVRSRIGTFNAAELSEGILRQFDISFQVNQVVDSFISSAYAHRMPSVLYRPTLTVDGNMWCALYGENLQDGVAGFGESPAKAMEAFDNAWLEKLSEVSQ